MILTTIRGDLKIRPLSIDYLIKRKEFPMPEGICEILVVMRHGEAVDKLCKLLHSLGYRVVEVCYSGSAALRGTSYHNYDIVLCSDNLPDMRGLSLALDILERKDVSIVMVTSEREKVSIESDYSDYDITCLVKPVSRMVLQHALEITWNNRKRFGTLKKERDRLKKEAAQRNLLMQAKQVLMKKYGFDEPKAYRSLQKTSMDTGVPVKEIAKRVIETDGVEFYRY